MKHLHKKSLLALNQPTLYTSAYIEFKAVLNAANTEEASSLAYKYVQLLDTALKKDIIYGFTAFTKKKINNIN